jgi:hypothetical protein
MDGVRAPRFQVPEVANNFQFTERTFESALTPFQRLVVATPNPRRYAIVFSLQTAGAVMLTTLPDIGGLTDGGFMVDGHQTATLTIKDYGPLVFAQWMVIELAANQIMTVFEIIQTP